ncbi:hypothetical protein FOE78_21260 [Microlunatus elymi]|uniref:Fe/B12 periplasmic-binding domain-containing protein n=1 Tax=Microlunatus elymi TaxID=2596828 RepID=A0A516Q3U0_9ACTN|nr:hypothetical protein [Microlunatus elymi]QDP98090.1 hypothetical protein FOE78_21260 [Microlunatus elymi]
MGNGHVATTLKGLGLTRPANQQKSMSGHSDPVSLERLDAIDADWMFFGALGDKAASQQAYRQAQKVKTFQQLSVQQAHQVVPVDGSAWTSAGGPLATRLVLQDTAAALAP